MGIEFVLTVLSGTLIFVLGQLLLKSTIEPLIAFRKVLGGLTYMLIEHQSNLLAGRATTNTKQNCYLMGARLIEAEQMVLGYPLLSWMGLVPVKGNILLAARQLCSMSNYLRVSGESESGKDKPSVDVHAANKISDNVEQIKNLLGIAVDLSS